MGGTLRRRVRARELHHRRFASCVGAIDPAADEHDRVRSKVEHTRRAGWTRSDLKAVSPPYVVGDHFILYVAADQGLAVVSLDPATGKTAWQAPASVSSITPGVGPALGVFGTMVTFLEPAGITQAAKLVGVDSATGNAAWTTPAGGFSDWPQPCADDTSAVCTTGTGTAGATYRLLRFKAATGAPLAAPVVSTSSSSVSRTLAPDLYDPGLRKPDQLVATNGSSVVWRRPLASLFPGSGCSTDYGWDFDRVPAVGLFVGSIGGPPVSTTASQTTVDLSRTATAGFRLTDGAAVWNSPGTLYACGFLPCPGATQASSGTYAYQPPTLGLRLRATGTETFGASPATPNLNPGARIVVEGFDLATGHTSWSVDAGASTALAQGTTPLQVGQEAVILPGTDGSPRVVDLTSGAQSTPSPGTVAWCQTNTTYTGPPHDDGRGGTSTEYVGAAARFPCSTTGQPVPAPSPVPAFVGQAVGGLVAWNEADKVVAAPSGG